MVKPSGIFQYGVSLNQGNNWSNTFNLVGQADLQGNTLEANVVPTSLDAGDGIVNFNEGGPPLVVVFSPLSIQPGDAADQYRMIVEQDIAGNGTVLTSVQALVALSAPPADAGTTIIGLVSVIVPDGQNRAL